jgi:tRNA(fMet)-specific endonuclease VapC
MAFPRAAAPFGDKTSRAALAAKSAAVGAHDLIIASTAVAIDFAVATRDLRSFPRITGLTLRRW